MAVIPNKLKIHARTPSLSVFNFLSSTSMLEKNASNDDPDDNDEHSVAIDE